MMNLTNLSDKVENHPVSSTHISMCSNF